VRKKNDSRRPTMADVAARAGVSKMTVSRVLNQHAGVADETAQRVVAAVDELNYVRSHRGRSLAVGRSHVLGMIVLDISSEWIWPLVHGAGRQAEELGYQVLLRTTGAGEVASFDLGQPPLDSDLLDGLIIVSWLVPLSFARQLAARKYPVVLIDAFERPSDVSWVGTRDEEGARLAVEHLVSQGHTRIGFISGGRRPYIAQQRQLGYEQGMAKAKLSGGDIPVVHGAFTQVSGYQAALELLRQPRPPTAILAANDLMALGVLRAANDLGRHVPLDLSVVGFDDIASASHTQPPLTTVARPYGDMGASAVRLLIDLISKPVEERQPQQVDLPTEWIGRQSTAPLAMR